MILLTFYNYGLMKIGNLFAEWLSQTSILRLWKLRVTLETLKAIMTKTQVCETKALSKT